MTPDRPQLAPEDEVVREVIRIALVGGGKAPVEALKLIDRYVDKRPLVETIPLSFDILEAAFFGTEEKTDGEQGF